MKLAPLAIAAALVLSPFTRAEEPADATKPANNKIKLDKVTGGGKVEVKELLKDDHDHPAPKPEAKPEPKKLEARITPDAKAELDKLTEAYKKLTALELSGAMTTDIVAGGQVVDRRAEFAATFAAPNLFRHEMKDDVLVGSTGKTLYAYRAARNEYKRADAGADRLPWNKLANPMRDLLREQDPSLLLAVVDDAGKYLAQTAKEIVKAPDVTIDGKACPAIDLKGGEKMDLRLVIDPKTHLIRQAIQDRRKSIEQMGQPDVTKALVTIDYASTKADAKLDGKQFAWAAPEGAKDAAAAQAEGQEATALVGKEAPDFTLNDLAGKPVAMKDQQGSVVVLDFWATWCGPCRESLPGLNKIGKELAPKGLKVFAVDLEEPKDTIQPVAAKLIPDLTVLLDEKSDTAKAYGVSGIPQTVVIGKDGKVRKVFVGSGNEAGIRAAVDKALGE
jgi:thiol-disulfide isomerase/thioredoxin